MLNSQWSSLWAIMVVLFIHSVAGVQNPCGCFDKDTFVKQKECLRTCRIGRSNESPVYPRNGRMQPLSVNLQNKRRSLSSDSGADLFSASSETQESWEGDSESRQGSRKKQKGKRSYAMEHFRWGKPVGKKRRPVTAKPTAKPNKECIRACLDPSNESPVYPRSGHMQRRSGNIQSKFEKINSKGGSLGNKGKYLIPDDAEALWAFAMEHFQWKKNPITAKPKVAS